MCRLTRSFLFLGIFVVIIGALIGCNSPGGVSDGGVVFIISIDSLSNNASTDSRTQSVDSADVPDPDPSSATIFNGTVRVYVNDSYTIADVIYNSETGKFLLSHPITLRSGDNTIYAVVLTTGASEYSRSDTWSITGNFTNPLYRAQLTWDTAENDVDLHLVKDGGWTDTNHCYYFNDVITGMAQLDYDDVDGYGPENMSIEQDAPAGSYEIIVKYFSTEGVTSNVNATVKIFDQTDTLISTDTHVFTPSDESLYDELSEDTDWNVTTLTVN